MREFEVLASDKSLTTVVPLKFSDQKTFDPLSTYVVAVCVSRAFQEIEYVYQSVLTQEEIERSLCFFFDNDRRNYIVRRYFLRTLLSKFNTVAPQQIQFHTYENMKPAVSGIEFNLSHSGDFIVIALSHSGIGIDIEYLKRSFDFRDVLTNCFNEEEMSFVLQGDIALNFYSLWTRKEAVLKATGEGLTDMIQLLNCLPDVVSRKEKSFKLITFRVQTDYVLSLAIDAKQTDSVIYLIH
jgi:4'-phosphopantetheinyl transferase